MERAFSNPGRGSGREAVSDFWWWKMVSPTCACRVERMPAMT